jgi:SAM-dependent methyltransferase
MTDDADPRLAWARSFGSDPDRYDRTRPRYPEAMVERILARSPGLEVLDVGCGTGIAARQFQNAGAHVLGVEPDERMAERARASGVDVEVSPFESWNPAGRRFHAVIAGQAWHWIDADAGTARAVEALRPSGRLALFWNTPQPQPDAAEAFAAVNRKVLPGPLANMWARPAVEGYSPLLAKAADAITGHGAFDPPEQWRYQWDWIYTRDAWLEQLPTFGGHTHLPPEQLEPLLAGIGAAIDALGGSFVMHYTTAVVTAARRLSQDRSVDT